MFEIKFYNSEKPTTVNEHLANLKRKSLQSLHEAQAAQEDAGDHDFTTLCHTFAMHRPPSLGSLASPRNSIPNTNSFSSLNGQSPCPSPSFLKSRASSLSLFSEDENNGDLLVKVFPFDSLGIDSTDSEKHTLLNYSHPDMPNPADVIKVPRDFLKLMQLLWRRHKILVTWRLAQDPFKIINRRYSFEIDGETIYDAKQTNTQTKTAYTYNIVGGHIPREEKFRDANKRYRLLDNKYPGAFHKSVKDMPCDKKLLTFLQENVSADVIDAKMVFENLITFAEMVEIGDKQDKVTARHPKHYIQEARTLFFVLDIIEQQIEQSKFISANTTEVIFYAPVGQICKLDITKLYPKFTPPKNMEFYSFEEFKQWVQQHNLEDHHAPVFTLKSAQGPAIYVPVMNLTGKHGLPIAGDLDPENICERSDAPEIIFESFNGVRDNPKLFINGLKILSARLRSKNEYQFRGYLNKLKKTIKDDKEVIEAFSDIFNLRNFGNFYDYTEDEYYNKTYLPIVEVSLATYIEHPELLQTAGQASLGGLVLHQDCDHDLQQHDDDHLNPQDVLDPMGMTFFYYETEELPNGKICITGNEESYVKFLLADPKILKDNIVCPHPCRLGNEDMQAHWSEVWLDILTIQALYAAKQNVERYKAFQRIILKDMSKRNSESERIARAKINDVFANISRYVNNHSLMDKHLQKLYQKYETSSAFIHQKLHHPHDTFRERRSSSSSSSSRSFRL